jgi:threonine/homoserine/homoserine lactone efflux protein
MGEAIGQMLPAAVGVAISPVPIVAVVLMLATPRARTNGPAFLAGWLLGLGVLGAILLTISNHLDPTSSSGPATWVSVVKLLAGLLLLYLALRQWQGRPRGGAVPAEPKWMAAVDDFTPVKSAGTGAVLSTANPKNFLLGLAGVEAIAGAGISDGEEAIAWLVFILIGSLGVIAPLAVYFGLGARSQQILEDLRGWMTQNSAVIMTVLLLVIGVKLVGDAISGFST